MKRSLATIVLCSMSGFCLAGEADVLDATVVCNADSVCRFDVTVQHADSGWDHYANRWDVLTLDGRLLGSRELLHPHVDEQPFTRSLTGVAIPQNTGTVLIRAGDSLHDYGGREIEVIVPWRTSDQALIAAANDAYATAIIAEDLDALMSNYADDAVQLPPGAPAIVGKDAIRAGWEALFSTATVLEATSTFDEIIVVGNWAYGRGRYSGKSQSDSDGAEYDERMSFSGMWQRGADGAWRIARDMWNDGAGPAPVQ